LTILSVSTWWMCPSQLSLCVLITLIIVWFLISLLSSLFILILHVLFNSKVGPNIPLNIFLWKTNSFCLMASLKTQVSQPCLTTGLTMVRYILNLDFLQTNLLFSMHLFA
jgi:hypothetical protein